MIDAQTLPAITFDSIKECLPRGGIAELDRVAALKLIYSDLKVVRVQ